MNLMIRSARAYYRANVEAWEALRRSRAATLPALIVLYLAAVFGLSASGHPQAAWVATVALGAPLLAIGWLT